ncbi:MAG: HNH endonuclease signature motif containing protein [Bryobacteraceae bacterium]
MAANGLSNLVVIFFLGIIVLWSLLALRARRGVLRQRFKALFIAVLIFFGCRYILLSRNLPTGKTTIPSLLAALIFFFLASPKRSRHIPRAVRASVIKRDLKGKRFNSNKHHIDHIYPYSRGGGHTEDNLRVVDKKKNLKKGAKQPTLWDWFS